MASSSSSSSQFLVLTVAAVWLVAAEPGAAVTLPFHPRDILPLLPRQVSRPILSSLNSAGDLLPEYVGHATDLDVKLNWPGRCFRDNTAWLEFHDNRVTIHLQVGNPWSYTCSELYVFATPYEVKWDWYFKSREHTIEFDQWESKAEYDYVKEYGVALFLMPAGMFQTLKASVDLIPLFINNAVGEKANIDFLKARMYAFIEERPEAARVSDVNADDINSGDFIVISRLRGPSGAFHTLQKWVTGSAAGHVAVCIRDPDGALWVAESGRTNELGEEVIGLVPWQKWWDYEKSEDDSSPNIALLRLSEEKRAVFNEMAAWEFVKSMDGKPYGYHNVIFSWLDTITENFPDPIDGNLVAAVMTVWNALRPQSAENMWIEALNLRLQTNGLSFPQITAEMDARGMILDELLAIPEQDDWEYGNGKSISCIALIIEMYKAAGLFGQLTDTIQGTEFTVRDGYMLNFFDEDREKQPKWCNEGDTMTAPYCQILGNYWMELPGFNSVDPYENMNQKCPTSPPHYDRPADC